MNYLLTILLFFLYGNTVNAQFYTYRPAISSIDQRDWGKLNNQVDSIEQAFPDSIVVPLTLNRIGSALFELKAYDQLKSYAYRMLQFDALQQHTRFPVTSDKKRDWYCHILCDELDARASYYLSTIFFENQQYDSCLKYIDHAFFGSNYAAIHNYSPLMAFGMHLKYMKSISLEHEGRTEEARTTLLPYLFLDSIRTTEGQVTHEAVIQQYNHLAEIGNNGVLTKEIIEKAIDSITTIDFLPVDAILLPMGWSQYYPTRATYYCKIEGKYIPILFNHFYALAHPYSTDENSIPKESPFWSSEFHRELEPPVAAAPLDPKYTEYMKGYVRETSLFRGL